MTMLGPDKLRELGVAEVGEGVQVDSTARLIGVERMRIGTNTRIDAFSVLSAGEGGLVIGSHVHLAAFVFIAGAAPVVLEDFVGLSGRVSVYSSNDDYSGHALSGPTVPDHLRDVTSAPVTFRRHAIVGAGSVVLPGVEVGLGSAVGALSLVNRDVPEFEVVAGVPARRIAARSRDLLELERHVRD